MFEVLIPEVMMQGLTLGMDVQVEIEKSLGMIRSRKGGSRVADDSFIWEWKSSIIKGDHENKTQLLWQMRERKRMLVNYKDEEEVREN